LLRLDQEDGVNITANSLHPGAIITNIVSPEVGLTIPKGNYHILPFFCINSPVHTESSPSKSVFE